MSIQELRLDASSIFGVLDPRALSGEYVSRRILETVREAAQKSGGEVRVDDATTLIAARQMEQVLADVLRDDFGPRWSVDYIPIGPFGVSAWARSYIQTRITRRGMVDWVTSANMPWLDADAQEISRRIRTFGGKIGWSWFDMQQAMHAGARISDEKAFAAREAAEEGRDQVLLLGDSGLPSGGGLVSTGFINDSTVPRISIGGGTWASKTPDQLLADVRTIMTTHRVQTRRSYRADTMLLPEAQYSDLEMRRLTDSDISVRKFILDNVEELQTIAPLPQLQGAGLAGADRGILYSKNPRIVRGVVPQPFNFLNPQFIDLKTTVFGVERIVGTEWVRPLGGLYFDGV